jgi:hypothetical protein
MGYLEEAHAFSDREVNQVICDIQQEFEVAIAPAPGSTESVTLEPEASLRN